MRVPFITGSKLSALGLILNGLKFPKAQGDWQCPAQLPLLPVFPWSPL